MQRFLLLAIFPYLVACQSGPAKFVVEDVYWQECTAVANEFRLQVEREQVENAGFPRFDAAPFLHSTRFFDALAQGINDDAQARELLSAMARLGDDIRRSENANLRNPDDGNLLNAISQCSFIISNDVRQARLRVDLVEQLKLEPSVQDHYSSAAQWLGILPILRPIFNWRIALLHEQEQAEFAAAEHFSSDRSYDLSPDQGQAVSDTAIRAAFDAAFSDSALNLPLLDESLMQELFVRYAPSLTVETLGPQDTLGTPTFDNGALQIDGDRVNAFYLPSYTRFANRNLLQLNYVFWFPAREPRAWIDLYSGKIDSLIWRVTLDEQGEVLLYDSIHSCGCYHKYFLASDAISSKPSQGPVEPANVFDVTTLRHDEGLHLMVTSNEHYIVGLDNQSPEATQSYNLASYSQLYNLDNEGRKQSLFDSDGIISGSERLERLTLWPTGIHNVGAMRQWGTHATGFIARQHFDDANLFDRYFSLDERD